MYGNFAEYRTIIEKYLPSELNNSALARYILEEEDELEISHSRLRRYVGNVKEETTPDYSDGKRNSPSAKPNVQGITAHDRTDFEQEILPYLKMIGEKAKKKNIQANTQEVIMPNKPFALVLLSDIHGGAKTDYTGLENDLNIIQTTEDMYVGNLGDNTDNFVVGKLANIQKEQSTTFDMEVRFLEWLFTKLKGSLVFWVSGNHDNWTKRVSGFDVTKEALKDVACLYDPHQIYFNLKWGDHSQKWLARHKWRNGSIFNATHGIEVGWERMGKDFDVGCSGHTHIATLCRPFIREEKKRFALLLGTYKVRDDFARDCGFPASYGTGSGAFVYHPDGRCVWCDDLSTAKDVLNMWKYLKS